MIIGKHAKSKWVWIAVGIGLIAMTYLLVQLDRQNALDDMNVQTQSDQSKE